MSSATGSWYPVTARAGTAATAVGVVGVVAAVFGLSLVSALSERDGDTIPSCWPAVGVAASAVALTAGRGRLVIVLSVAIASWGAAVLTGRSPVAAAYLAAGSAAGAALSGGWLGRRLELLTMRDLGRLLAAAGGGALLAGGVVAAGTGPPPGEPGPVWATVAASHGAAVIVLVPLVMRLPARLAPAGRGETVVLSAAVLGTTLAVFAPGQRLPLVFLPVAVLVWTGLRVGLRTVSVQLLAAGVLAVLLTTQGAGPFAAFSAALGPGGPVLLVQTFLMASALVVFAFTLSVAQRDSAYRALADQRRFDQAILEVVNAGVLVCDADGTIVLRNAAYRHAVGVGEDEPVDTVELPHGAQLSEDGVPVPACRTPLRRALAGEEITAAPMQVRLAGQPPHEIVVMARQIHSADGRLLGAVSAFTDVTAERAVQARLRESVAFRDAILAVIPDDIYLFDVTTFETLWCTRTLASWLGYGPSEVQERGRGALDALVHPDDAELVHAAHVAAGDLADGEVQALRVRVRGRDGQYRWLARRAAPFSRGPDGRVRQLIGVRHASGLVEAEQLLTEAALHDPLTGLPNRRLLGDRLDAALSTAAITGELVAVLFCDLDEFKAVNDTGGHAVGDALLKASGERLRAVLRPEDTVARVGGDEFVVILVAARREVGPDTAQARTAAVIVARRIIRSLAGPIHVAGRTYAVTVSIGVAFAGEGDTAEQTLRNADIAMYRAKTRGKNRYELFDRSGPTRTVHQVRRA